MMVTVIPFNVDDHQRDKDEDDDDDVQERGASWPDALLGFSQLHPQVASLSPSPPTSLSPYLIVQKPPTPTSLEVKNTSAQPRALFFFSCLPCFKQSQSGKCCLYQTHLGSLRKANPQGLNPCLCSQERDEGVEMKEIVFDQDSILVKVKPISRSSSTILRSHHQILTLLNRTTSTWKNVSWLYPLATQEKIPGESQLKTIAILIVAFAAPWWSWPPYPPRNHRQGEYLPPLDQGIVTSGGSWSQPSQGTQYNWSYVLIITILSSPPCHVPLRTANQDQPSFDRWTSSSPSTPSSSEGHQLGRAWKPEM